MGIVAGSEPFNKAQNITISPHPGRKRRKSDNAAFGIFIIGQPHDVAVNPIGVRPVCLDRYRGESTFVNKTSSDASPFTVEVVRAMRRLPNEDETPIADEID